MTLSFKTKLFGEPTYFVEKIIAGLRKLPQYSGCYLCNKYTYNPFVVNDCFPKIHTLRVDNKDRWKPGVQIHFVINNRTKNRFQFVPCFPVVSVQRVWINPANRTIDVWVKNPRGTSNTFVDWDWKRLTEQEVELLSKNDGFSTQEKFWKFFNKEFVGKIIHWTDFQY